MEDLGRQQPIDLRIREQVLPMIWRAQNVNVEIKGCGCNESAAMSVVVRSDVRNLLASLPDYVMARYPSRLDGETVQELFEPFAAR